MPRYTNNANLPQPLVSALTYSDYDKDGDISVTALILPLRIRQLQIRHDAELTEDVSELIWRMIGSIGHKILERADTDNHLPEERLRYSLHGWIITGKADLLAPDMTLTDWKFTSVWAMKDAKPEWEQQINLYALLYRHNGFEVKKARIVAVLRDWSKMRASREPNYPQVGVVVREVPLWPVILQEEFLFLRVRAHQMAEKIPDEFLALCTPEERWRRPDVWAVKKKGGKRAIRLFTDKDDASLYAAYEAAKDTYEIEHRRGEDTRCLHYCPVKNFCSYGKLLPAGQNGDLVA